MVNLIWIVCLILSFLVLIGSILISIFYVKEKGNSIISRSTVLIVGVFAAIFFIFVPIYSLQFDNDFIILRIFKTIFVAAHHSLRLFIVDTDFEIIRDASAQMGTGVYNIYSNYVAVLYILAPITTVIKSLSFFKKLTTNQKLNICFEKDMYVFTEINKKSIALAKDILKTYKDSAVIFTNVLKEEKYLSEDLEELNKLDVLCLENDVLTINFKKHNKNKKLAFFVISEDEEKNIGQGLNLIEDFKNIPNSWLYVFSNSTEGEILFSNVNVIEDTLKKLEEEHNVPILKNNLENIKKQLTSIDEKLEKAGISAEEKANLEKEKVVLVEDKKKLSTELKVLSDKLDREASESHMRIRRVSDIKSLVQAILEKNGEKIFKVAEVTNNKTLSILIVGMGKIGFEMAKTLVWFGQMEGYRLEITCVDRFKEIEEKFKTACPELMELNGNFEDDGEAQYRIKVLPNVSLESEKFRNIVNSKKFTYVFVAFGTDELNINSSIYLRTLFKQKGENPMIQTVIRSFDRMEILKKLVDMKNQSYEIDFIDELNELYKVKSFIDSDLINEGLQRHLKWGTESEFWRYEYNYRSSIASALHKRMKKACKMPGIELEPDKRSEHDKLRIRIIEHRRWNAYMRSEGFVHNEIRDDMAKQHTDLVTFSKLDKKKQELDDD